MGCGSCGTKTADGKPGGCQSNGGCGTGSCNRMNVHDWLRNLPFADPESSCKIVEISFKQGSRKEYYRNTTLHYYEKGSLVTLETQGGYDIGEVSLTGELVRLQLKKKGLNEATSEFRKIHRLANEREIDLYFQQKGREQEVLARSRAISRQMNMQMKLIEVEIQADAKRATFYYTADERVDFREMIKIFATEFKFKVEMRQIGIRQEAAKVGGIGSCGRELCCSTWLQDFKSVNTTAARYQNLSINQTKLSGQCGRLKCCLNYELDTYLDALQQFPTHADMLEVQRGRAHLIKKDIFKNLMWYTLPDSNKQYPLTIDRVLEIKELNAQGQKPDELGAIEIVSGRAKEAEPEFVDVVGQLDLQTLNRQQQRRNKPKPENNRPAKNNGGARMRPPQPPAPGTDPAAVPKPRRPQGSDGAEPKPQNVQRNPQKPGDGQRNRPPRNQENGAGNVNENRRRSRGGRRPDAGKPPTGNEG